MFKKLVTCAGRVSGMQDNSSTLQLIGLRLCTVLMPHTILIPPFQDLTASLLDVSVEMLMSVFDLDRKMLINRRYFAHYITTWQVICGSAFTYALASIFYYDSFRHLLSCLPSLIKSLETLKNIIYNIINVLWRR